MSKSSRVELYCNLDKPMDRCIRFLGQGIVPLQGDSEPGVQAPKLPPVRSGRRLSQPNASAFPEAHLEPPPGGSDTP
jgi:hypothetical protein